MRNLYTLFLACTLLILCSAKVQAQLGLELMGNIDFANNQEVSDIWAYADPFGNEYAIVGAQAGTYILDVTDPTSPEELHFIPGVNTTWRDMKVWGQFAYVINENENEQNSNGLTIIDLSELPTDIEVHTYNGSGSVIWNSAHNIFMDENGFAYIFGADYGEGGAIILDVKENFTEPPVVGVYDEEYIHDGYVRGDTLWAGEVYAGNLTVIDVRVKASPVVLSSIETPGSFTHNCWLDDAGDYIYTTDEVSSGFVAAYDVRDIYDMKLVDKIQSDPGLGSVPHNAFVLDNWLLTSWYRDGVIVHDATYPDNLVEVGYFDTSPGVAGDGFSGTWGVYPYLPSGNILISDMQAGLSVFAPTYKRACYLEGTVVSAQDGVPISSAEIQIVSDDQTERSNLFGAFKTGIALAGTYSVSFSKPGFEPKTVEGIELEHGEITNIEVELEPLPNFVLNGKVISDSGDNVEDAVVYFVNGEIVREATTNVLGNYELSTFVSGTYDIMVGKWGYVTREILAEDLISGEEDFVIELQEGYYDDFVLDFGWSVSGDAVAGIWERAVPSGTFYGNNFSNANVDVEGDLGDFAMVTGNQASGQNAGGDDVDDGVTILTSPVFDLSNYNSPKLTFHRWFFNNGGVAGSGDPNDFLTVRIENGITSQVLDIAGPNDPMLSQWSEREFYLKEEIELTENMVLVFETGDEADTGHLVEAGVDFVQIIEDDPWPVTVEEELLDQDIVVSPNPTSDFVHVSQENRFANGTFFRLFNSMGHLVLQKRLNQASTKVRVGHLPQGLYCYQVADRQGQLQAGRLMIR